jgi:predicted membrane protein DUF2157
MIGLALLVVVVVFVVAYSSSRHRASTDATHVAAPVEVRAAGLERWVAAGLISDDQARAITAFEQAQATARPKPRVSPAIEALAYVGGVLLAVGAAMLVGQFWDRLGTGGHLAVLGLAAALTGVVGVVVGESDPVTWRLRGFLWALSAGAAATAAGVFVYEVPDPGGQAVALSTAGAAALASALYWQLRDRPLQHVLTFIGIAVSLGVAIFWIGGAGTAAAIGFALWLLGATWAGLAWQRRIPPSLIGFPLGVALTLIASGIVTGQIEWLAPVLGLATAAAWVGVGAATSEPLAMAPGVLGVFVFLPWALGYFFGESLGAPAIAMLSGAVLLGVVVLLVRRGRGDGPISVGWGRHFRPIAHG